MRTAFHFDRYGEFAAGDMLARVGWIDGGWRFAFVEEGMFHQGRESLEGGEPTPFGTSGEAFDAALHHAVVLRIPARWSTAKINPKPHLTRTATRTTYLSSNNGVHAMRQTTIINRKDFAVVSYGNGVAYDFQNKRTDESVDKHSLRRGDEK